MSGFSMSRALQLTSVLAGLALLSGAPAGAAPLPQSVEQARAIDIAADPTAAVTAWQAALPGLTGQARGEALARMAAALVAAQRSEEAVAPIEEAAPLLAKAPPIDRARLLSTKGAALADLNKLTEADAALDAAEADWAAAPPSAATERAEAMMTRATVAFARGDLAAAKRIGTAALAVDASGGGPPTAARIGLLGNMSTIHLQARELEESERYAREATTLAAAILPEDHPTALVALNNWVAALAAQGRREESVDILGRVARIRERKFGPNYPPLAITYNNLSRNLMFLGRASQAEPFARKAVAIAEATRAPDDQALATMRDNLADILDDLGRPADSSTLRRAALAGLGKTNENRAMRIRRSLAVSLAKQGDAAGALAEYEAVGTWLARTRPPENPDVIESDAARAALEARLGKSVAHDRMAGALDRLERSLFSGGDASRRLTSLGPTLSQLLETAWLTKDRAAGFRVAQLVTWGDAGRAMAAATAREAAGPNAALVRRRQDLLNERDRQTEVSLRAFGTSPADYQAAAAQVTRIDASLRTVEAELARTVPAFSAMARFTPAPEAEVRARLAPGQALMLTTPIDNGAITFVLRRTAADWAASPRGRDLAAETSAFRRTLADGGKFDATAAYRLYRALVPGALDRTLAGADTWVIASGGAFSTIPYAALVTDPPRPGAQPAWLIRKVALATAPGVADLNAPATAVAAGDRFVGIGAPALSGSVAIAGLRGLPRGGATGVSVLSQLASLPAAQRELESMARALGATSRTLLTGAQATEGAVKSADFRGVRVLAFATHGLVGGAIEPGSEPGLVMTPPAGRSADDDGLLSASEIARLDLPVDWVVLSACDTAAGANPRAPALSGLARAFLYAGVRSLLVSHWAVRDDVAARLTVDTVRNAGTGISRAQALRKAMLALIADRRVVGGSDPAIWAPFILVQR